jgi:hypothetical protein
MGNLQNDCSPERLETRDVHIKRVPQAIWLRARQNALASGLAFKEFVIRLLDDSQPYPPAKRLPDQQQCGTNNENFTERSNLVLNADSSLPIQLEQDSIGE